MKNWDSRAREIAYLLNPAFCSRLLHNTMKSYILESNHPFPFPLVYLILPLLLHRESREKINSRTQFINWIQNNEYLLIDFAERAKSLVPISNESLEYLLQSGHIIFTGNAEFDICHTIKALSKTKFAEDDIKVCIEKSEHIGKWFARTGRVETVYSILGVRP